MPTYRRYAADGTLHEEWEIPIARIRFAIVALYVLPVLLVPVDVVLKRLLSTDRYWAVARILAPPFITVGAIAAWKLGGLFWPNVRIDGPDAPLEQ